MTRLSLKNLGLGLGTLGVIGTLWLLLAPNKTQAIRPRTGLPNCAGETGRFQITGYNQRIFLLDTCSGEVWRLMHSPDKLEPGAWVIMDHYDTRDEALRLIDYLRGSRPTGTTAQTQDPAQQLGLDDQGENPSTDQQPHAAEESPGDTEYQETTPAPSYGPTNQPTYRRQ